MKCKRCGDVGWIGSNRCGCIPNAPDPMEPAEPSPEVAPMQREICNEPHSEGSKYAANKHCVHGRLLTDDCTDCPVPAVAPRETQPELDEILRRGAHYSKTLPKEAYGSTNSRPDVPATQHRVIPVEWHRVAVEPARKMPISGGGHVVDPEEDNAPEHVAICQWCKYRLTRFEGKWAAYGFGEWVWVCPSRPTYTPASGHEPAAQPANTDDRQADTIPDDLILSMGEFLEAATKVMADEPTALRIGIALAKFYTRGVVSALARERTGPAETRIEVLEAALRDMVKAVDQLFEQCVPVVPEYPTRWRLRDNEASRNSLSYINAARLRASLAAPSGETP